MNNQHPYCYSLDIPVRDYELDSEGIVNNAVYLHYLEHTRHCFCRQAGLSVGNLTSGGLIPVVSRLEVDYKTPLHSGDVAVSRLWVERKGVRFVFHQDLYREGDGMLVARAVVTIVCIEDGRPSRGEPLAEALTHYLESL